MSKLCVCGQVVCVSKLCVSKLCVDKLCEDKRRREEADGRRDTESKTRTPHKDVGNKRIRAFPEMMMVRNRF